MALEGGSLEMINSDQYVSLQQSIRSIGSDRYKPGTDRTSKQPIRTLYLGHVAGSGKDIWCTVTGSNYSSRRASGTQLTPLNQSQHSLNSQHSGEGPGLFKERGGLQLDFTDQEEFDERDVFLHPGDDDMEIMWDSITEGEETDFTVLSSMALEGGSLEMINSDQYVSLQQSIRSIGSDRYKPGTDRTSKQPIRTLYLGHVAGSGKDIWCTVTGSNYSSRRASGTQLTPLNQSQHSLNSQHSGEGPGLFKERGGLQLDFTDQEEFDERDVFLHPGDDDMERGGLQLDFTDQEEFDERDVFLHPGDDDMEIMDEGIPNGWRHSHLVRSYQVSMSPNPMGETVMPESQIQLFRSRGWLPANQGPVFPDSVAVQVPNCILCVRNQLPVSCSISDRSPPEIITPPLTTRNSCSPNDHRNTCIIVYS
eukprot:sb/3465007/